MKQEIRSCVCLFLQLHCFERAEVRVHTYPKCWSGHWLESHRQDCTLHSPVPSGKHHKATLFQQHDELCYINISEPVLQLQSRASLESGSIKRLILKVVQETG